jgi:UDP:flavonoid glycosyltransferase YjiC (YdhE family)
MARVVFAMFGSLGDLHPVVAVARVLSARGHEVMIATSEFYREKVGRLGLDFHALRPNLSLVDSGLVRRVMDGVRGSTFLMRDLVFPSVRDMYADLVALAPRVDAIVASELVCAAPLVAATTGVRWISYALAPVSLFSVHVRRCCRGRRARASFSRSGPRATAFSGWRRSACRIAGGGRCARCAVTSDSRRAARRCSKGRPRRG